MDSKFGRKTDNISKLTTLERGESLANRSVERPEKDEENIMSANQIRTILQENISQLLAAE